MLGFLLAVVIAIASAAAMDRTPPLRRALEPLLVTSQTIPIVALAPLFLLWFGFGLAPKVLVVVLVTFFPIVVALLDGFRSAQPEAADLLRSYGASDGQAFRFLRWPSALPNLFVGLRISVVYAVIGAVFGEYVGAREGLGIWMQISRQRVPDGPGVRRGRGDVRRCHWCCTGRVGALRRVVVPWAPGVRHERAVSSEPF